MSTLLDKINYPDDLASLDGEELVDLAGEIRSLIISTVSETGGHLAANLGVVELTIALLRIFSPPRDKILFDTGHQCYAYKILTGRKDRMGTLRQYEGLSGFLLPSESEYDAFGVGHAGTALSAALGMAAERDRREGDEHVIAVLGDAAAGCGISFEALNNVATSTKRVIVILNDNEMSIAENVGSLSGYLGYLLANPRYNRWKKSVEAVAHRLRMGRLRRFYYRIEESIKGVFLRSVFFEEFGLRYIGPIDGHNMPALLDALRVARNYDRPIILHVTTRKGKGYCYAEAKPEVWHGTSAFDIDSGEQRSKEKMATWSQVFGQALSRLAEKDERIVAITAAMRAGTGLAGFAERFPKRLFDVGISEEHAVVFAAGLAAQGCVPVLAVYSTFLQRAVDCVIHDVCLQNLPVVICLDRAGIVGDDGPTHHGVFDIALLRPIPGLVIMQPRDEAELANMLYTACGLGRPVVIRYPRGASPGAEIPQTLAPLEIGQSEVMREGGDVQFWALGDMLPLAEAAAGQLAEAGISAGIINARFIRPLDEDRLRSHGQTARVIATLENGVVSCGFGSGVASVLQAAGFQGKILPFGWPDEFVPHGAPAILLERYGMTADQIVKQIRQALSQDE